ncbi:peptidase S41 [Variovorax sp. RKNM96]|uniref:S41 family peptidase n=1 Tax=Variovorax sp. RKNM96 TaxID=2681552 RepID=UPI00197E4D62|nr:S41 family peptidase [Variovorax sp. RKNM96]QSI28228.1 peptidase S41 [Variovorax sp. RKNM96]
MGFRNTDLRQLPRPGAWAAAAVLAVAGLLAGCGGGGGGGGGGGFPIGGLPPGGNPPTNGGGGLVPSSEVAGQCAAPRRGINPETGTAYPDTAGTVDNEKSWVRSWIDETYLWYNEVPTNLVAADYATPVAFFNVLKTPATTSPSGRAKDRFHYIYDTEAYRQLSNAGVSPSYGIEFAFARNSRPNRDLRVAFVEPHSSSPAAAQGIARGARILEIDGVDVLNGTNTAVLNRGISPQAAGETHTFKLQEGSATRTIDLTAALVTRTPVQNVKTIGDAGNRVGYLLFNDHITTSEAQLIAAVNKLKENGGIQDLVLDMRYNGGGQLSIASQLAYMVAGPSQTAGKTFELLSFNDKNPFHRTLVDNFTPFITTTSRTKQPLPTLGLSRVTVLTSPDTCSASESVINSLRGIGVTVNLVGGTTCGKPYGFLPQDNCGTTYFAIQFKGVNQAGFGDYGDGFAPNANCTVADDFGHQLGDPAEARLAAALALRSSGSCPVPAASAKAVPGIGLDKAGVVPEEEQQPALLNRSPLRENRLIDPLPNAG